MPDDPTVGLGNEPADTTLDSLIDKAIDSQPSADDPPPPAVDGATESGERLRDDLGRFAKDATGAAPEGSAAPVNAEVGKDAQPALTPQSIEPPARWSEADKAQFAALPPEAKAILVERNRAMEADYTRKSQETAEFRRTADPLLQAVQPYAQYLSQVGMTPQHAVNMLLGAEYSLRTGTAEQKYQALAKIAGDYGVDLAALARGEVATPDPAITQQRQYVQSLEQRLAQIEQQTQAQQQQQVSQEIQSFTNEKDEAGRPKHPHFEKVMGICGHLISTGQARNLQEAYPLAAAPIEQAIAEGLRVQQESRDKQQQEAVTKAKKAAPVKVSGTQPNGSAGTKGLDAILSDRIAQAGIL